MEAEEVADTGTARVGAWSALWPLAGVALALRIAFGFSTEATVTPDEIYQILEQAHRLVFGIGIIPWEFRFGTRTWIVPGLVAAPLWVSSRLGIDSPALYVPIVKVFLCLLSMTLPFTCRFVAFHLGGERAGRLAFVFACFWYEFVAAGHRPLSTVVATYLLVGVLALAIVPGRAGRAWALGALGALCLTVRVQLAPAVALLGVVAAVRGGAGRAREIGLAFALGVLVAGAVDFWTWGVPFSSHVNNVRFNLYHGFANTFGKHPFYWYLPAFAAHSYGFTALALGWVLLRPRRLGMLWLCVIGLLVPHSLIAHKEYRFVFALLPPVFCGLSVLVSDWWAARRTLPVGAQLAAAALAWVSAFRLVAPVFGPPDLQTDARRAYMVLADDPSTRGVLDATQPLWSAGGYYYLHRDVPLYAQRPDDFPPLETRIPHVSHVLTLRDDPVVLPGFDPAGGVGGVEILRRADSGADVVPDPLYDFHMPQRGIDGRFVPTARPRI